MRLRLPRGRLLEIARPPAVMGILNVTPDSFSDGGVHFDHTKAVHAALQMEADGAAVIDVGGESTRPGSAAITIDQEIARVVPVIGQIRARSEVPISIDTRKSAVARAALEAGADMINDVSGLTHDPALADVAREADVPLIVMHMRGTPETMQSLAVYDDVVADVARELRERLANALGVAQLLVDPGIGFAKTFEHNLALLARCNELTDIAPLVIGASRKAFIGHLTGRDAGPQRAIGSLAAVAAAHRGGAAMVRVHDVRETIDFLRVLQAIEERRPR
ncbi:MAG: dihydropteroate synthase [Acidobacteria bacterium]|nr:dihydropteroate synthase [Acidobacteriota bacterium]